jgi:hypothetical protein
MIDKMADEVAAFRALDLDRDGFTAGAGERRFGT